MKAPENIYISLRPSISGGHVYTTVNKDFPNAVKYIRTDAFIEKACELLARMVWEVTYEDLEGNSVQHYDKMEFIDDFRNYLKGE